MKILLLPFFFLLLSSSRKITQIPINEPKQYTIKETNDTSKYTFQDTAKVYIGGGDEHTGAYDGYLKDPNRWTWVRQNADGYYVI